MTTDSQQAEREAAMQAAWDKRKWAWSNREPLHISVFVAGFGAGHDAGWAAGRAEGRAEGRADRIAILEHDLARIEALEDVLERYMLYVDEWGYEEYGQLAKRFGPVEHEGSSISTEAWLDRVLREPARALLPSEGEEQS